MKYGVILALVCVAQTGHAQDYPDASTQDDYIDPQQELARIGSMDGTWVGHLNIVYDPNGANREWPDGFPIQIEISGEEIRMWLIEDGGVLDRMPGDAALILNIDGTALVDYFAGNDAYNEIWSISLNQTDPDVLKGFVSRTVHNFAYRKESPWRVFPVYSTIEFKRSTD